MGLADSDDILDDIFLPSSTKTEQNVGKFAPKPGSKLKKPLITKAKLWNAPSSIEANLGQVANTAKSNAVAVSTQINPVKKASKLVGEKEVLSGDIPETISNKIVIPTNFLNDATSTTISFEHTLVEEPAHASSEPLVLTELSQVSEEHAEVSTSVESFDLETDPLSHSSTVVEQVKGKFRPKQHSKSTSASASSNSDDLKQNASTGVKQSDKFQPKSALSSKRSKNKSVSFILPDETEKIPSHKQGLESLDLNTTLEPDEDNLFNGEDSFVKIANEHAELLENDEEFESIDDIMDIDSWDEPSIPAKLKNDGADKGKTLGGLIKRNSTRTFENDNRMNNDSKDIGDLIKLNDDDDEDSNWTPNDMIDTKKTTKRKRKSFEESDSEKVKEPRKRIPHGTRRKKRQADKTLLKISEHEIDLTQLPIRDLILLAEAKERISSKEAAISMSTSNHDSNADHENPLDEGFDPDSEEAHRHWLKHAKKVNYHTHMNLSRSLRWSKEETALFYEAIRDFKTNFGMMAWLFPGRTSRQLKAKFKAEERKHPFELRDALDFRSKDHTLFDKVIQVMKEQREAEDAAANEAEEEIGQPEKKENAATKSNHKVDNSDKTDPWNDGDFDFNESADFEFDVNDSLTQNMEENVDTEKEKAENDCGDEVKNSEKKDLWDDDFELLEEDLESETDAASSQFDEKIDEK